MKNLINTNDRNLILARIDALQGDERAQWGTLTVARMVCHAADQIRMTLGEITAADRSNVLTRTLLIRLILLGLPMPKGRAKTAPEIEPTTGHGTPPTTFAQDTAALKQKIAAFLATDENFAFQRHSVFGALSRHQWGRLIYLHLDHHLQQFGR